MRFPDFLIVGGMKCGTTSLFFDLGVNPAVFIPEDKEPHALVDDRVLAGAGRRQYADLFQGARDDQICGEASTGYTKLPDIVGVPERARRLLGRPRIIYLVREPVSRVVSHHHHALAAGAVHPEIDRAVRDSPMLLDYSRYAMQIRPWIDAMGADRVRVVRFEDYVRDRPGTVAELSRFLGIEPATEGIELDKVHNPGGDRRVPGGRAWRISRGGLYRSLLRPLLPRSLRGRLRRMSMPPSPPRPAPPSAETVEHILESLAEDSAALQRITGAMQPLWNAAEVRARYQPAGESGAG